MQFLKFVWQCFSKLGLWMGNFITCLFLAGFYYTIFAIYALFFKPFHDPLGLSTKNSNWRIKKSTPEIIQDFINENKLSFSEKILGLSFFYHDSAAVLLVHGKPIAMAEEERFSRKKHDYDFPQKAINFVLNKGNIQPKELDYVIFYEKPFLKLDRILKTSFATFPFAPFTFVRTIKNLFIDKLWIREIIAKKVGIDYKKILFSEHHLSHAASSFLCSPYDRAGILTIDGIGEWACTTVGIGKGNKIKILKEVHFPHSLGLLYSAFTAFLGFRVNSGEYKVMGMAPYGKPKYVDKVKKLIQFFDDGSYALDMDYFCFHRSTKKTYSSKFIKLFGKPRSPESKFFTRESGWPSYFGSKPESKEYQRMVLEQEYYADLAASIQKVLEQAIIRLAKEAYKLTNCSKLCFAGGVALNSVVNWKIIQNTPFEEIFIQPAAGDSGGALGAALYLHNSVFNQPRKFLMKHVYYGEEYTCEEIKNFIYHNNLKAKFFENENKLLDAVVEELTNGKIVGWFNGRFEWGPRALGSRSILADPRRDDMKDIVNAKIKFREPYRPFAPSVLAEYAQDFFNIPQPEAHYPARFMLYVVKVKKEKRKIIPAVTHLGGTSRIHLVFKQESPRYWNLINRFYKITGVPLVLNTSFNLRGEPIVNAPEQAFSTFSRSEMDILVLENFLIKTKKKPSR